MQHRQIRSQYIREKNPLQSTTHTHTYPQDDAELPIKDVENKKTNSLKSANKKKQTNAETCDHLGKDGANDKKKYK